MMGTTHALMGLLLGSTAYFIDPSLLLVAGMAGYVGGVLPDLDMPFDHRKTFHYPFYFTVTAAGMLPIAALFPSALTVFLFYMLASAAAHSYIDVLGGGLEERPWKGNSDRAVYHHRKGEWLEPRRIIRYDGSPEDFGLGLILGAASILVYGSPIPALVAASLFVSLIYTLVRKKLVDWAPDRLKEIL